jgi:hypothetical protein
MYPLTDSDHGQRRTAGSMEREGAVVPSARSFCESWHFSCCYYCNRDAPVPSLCGSSLENYIRLACRVSGGRLIHIPSPRCRNRRPVNPCAWGLPHPIIIRLEFFNPCYEFYCAANLFLFFLKQRLLLLGRVIRSST